MAKFVIFLDYYHNVYDGMGVGRLDECYQKREGMVKRNNSWREKSKDKTT